jgi:hypothetical protein
MSLKRLVITTEGNAVKCVRYCVSHHEQADEFFGAIQSKMGRVAFAKLEFVEGLDDNPEFHQMTRAGYWEQDGVRIEKVSFQSHH